MYKKINFFIVYYLPVLFWMSLIFKLSSGTVPSASPVFWQDFVVKKLAHFLFFGFLAILIYRALSASGVKKKNALIYAIILAILYGVTDEFHQGFTTGRESRIRDVIIDGLGAFVMTNFTHKFLEKNKKWQKKLL